MQNEITRDIDRTPIGKGVFQPSRAAIAQEMELRLRLNGLKAEPRQPQATGSRH